MSTNIVYTAVRGLFSQLGYTIHRTPLWPDMDAQTIALFRSVRSFTMTSIERVYALRESVKYIIHHNIPGSIVECGVWKGGSMMAVAKTLLELKTARDLYLFDTFQGMPPPTAVDVDLYGIHADVLLKTDPLAPAIAPFEEVAAICTRLDMIPHASTSFGVGSRTPFQGRPRQRLPSCAWIPIGTSPPCMSLSTSTRDWPRAGF